MPRHCSCDFKKSLDRQVNLRSEGPIMFWHTVQRVEHQRRTLWELRFTATVSETAFRGSQGDRKVRSRIKRADGSGWRSCSQDMKLWESDRGRAITCHVEENAHTDLCTYRMHTQMVSAASSYDARKYCRNLYVPSHQCFNGLSYASFNCMCAMIRLRMR